MYNLYLGLVSFFVENKWMEKDVGPSSVIASDWGHGGFICPLDIEYLREVSGPQQKKKHYYINWPHTFSGQIRVRIQ